MSSDRIVNKIYDLFPPYLQRSTFTFNHLKYRFLNVIRDLKSLIYIYSDSYRKHKIYLKHKIGYIYLEEIKKDLNFLNKKRLPLRVKKIDKNIFFLKRI